jgi:hypothetical protein
MTTKRNCRLGNRRKVRGILLIVYRKKVEMGEGNRRWREKIWLKLNIKRWVLWLTFNGYIKWME